MVVALISSIGLQSGPNFSALHCHQALILSFAPPSCTNSKHWAAIGRLFQASQCCLALFLSIAPLLGTSSQHCTAAEHVSSSLHPKINLMCKFSCLCQMSLVLSAAINFALNPHAGRAIQLPLTKSY
jgi:hypothetical protein